MTTAAKLPRSITTTSTTHGLTTFACHPQNCTALDFGFFARVEVAYRLEGFDCSRCSGITTITMRSPCKPPGALKLPYLSLSELGGKWIGSGLEVDWTDVE